MPCHVPINILDFIFKGMLIGMIASAPMGPVGVLCVQRTLNKGRWYGLVTGIGAAISDIFYAGVTNTVAQLLYGFPRDVLEPTYYLPFYGAVRTVCLRAAQPSFRDVRWIFKHRGGSVGMVVRTDVARG